MLGILKNVYSKVRDAFLKAQKEENDGLLLVSAFDKLDWIIGRDTSRLPRDLPQISKRQRQLLEQIQAVPVAEINCPTWTDWNLKLAEFETSGWTKVYGGLDWILFGYQISKPIYNHFAKKEQAGGARVKDQLQGLEISLVLGGFSPDPYALFIRSHISNTEEHGLEGLSVFEKFIKDQLDLD